MCIKPSSPFVVRPAVSRVQITASPTSNTGTLAPALCVTSSPASWQSDRANIPVSFDKRVSAVTKYISPTLPDVLADGRSSFRNFKAFTATRAASAPNCETSLLNFYTESVGSQLYDHAALRVPRGSSLQLLCTLQLACTGGSSDGYEE